MKPLWVGAARPPTSALPPHPTTLTHAEPPGSWWLCAWLCLPPAFQQLRFLAAAATTHVVLSALAFNAIATQTAICTPTAAEEQHIHTYRMGMCRKL